MPQDNHLKSKTSLRKKITLIVFGFILTFVILEISLRLGGFIVLSIQEYRNRQSLKYKNGYRILCIGESTTQGQYPRFLDKILNQGKKDPAFIVIDKGMTGANSFILVDNIDRYLDTYRPAIVVAMMGGNDYYTLYYKDIPEADSPIFKHCRVYRLMRLIYCRIAEKANKAPPAVDHEPRSAEFYIDLGQRYKNQGDFNRAVEALKQCIAFNPHESRCYVGLGRLYVIQVRFHLAEQAFRQGIAINPKNPNCYFGLGNLYIQQNKLSLAEEVFKQGIAANPKDINCYTGIGEVYVKQDQLLLAEKCLLKGNKLNPNDERLCGLLAVLYRAKGQHALAQEYYRKAEALRLAQRIPVTTRNYRRLKEILDRRGIRLVCVQYPMRSIESLKNIFKDEDSGVIFVDNERIFKDAVAKDGYNAYFRDIFAGDFGHCTDKGNRLLAENIAEAILKEALHK